MIIHPFEIGEGVKSFPFMPQFWRRLDCNDAMSACSQCGRIAARARTDVEHIRGLPGEEMDDISMHSLKRNAFILRNQLSGTAAIAGCTSGSIHEVSENAMCSGRLTRFEMRILLEIGQSGESADRHSAISARLILQ